MKHYPIILLLCYVGLNAQNISKINKDLKLSNSLTHSTEIRIYRGGGITNYSTLFRMYKTDMNIWKAEFYEHFDEVLGHRGKLVLRTKKKKISSKNDMALVYKNLLRSYILELPSIETIQWKLKKRGGIERIVYKHKGEKYVEYETVSSQIAFLDGQKYTVQIQSKAWKKKHAFTYNNPESHLKHFPEIDEIVYMNEILSTIKNEFDIWKE
ncbi:hypothetical protein U8527_13410 [Kordia algicida OT-1]|uniref:Uncharacterized protein n=1 Tax=Kordia algicida OT-1 TaxID=391587 RepID=A9E5Q7_9FLAO|nr:hypothetical protein [Kordia algicida]EDP95210.1 hypothetical protein KAOT1_06992 [Kordia algicida OT-1]